ncbi:MAG: hypothetical protein LBU42_03775 [Prevotellaceae bacterium]|jgi:hypothetical protein|nr:hypothetical protein [Prevotellaceae bacterium]
MKNTDWIPQARQERYHLAERTTHYLINPARRTRMGLAPDTPLGQWLDNTFIPAFTNVTGAFTAWSDQANRTPIVIATLVMTEKVFIPLFRQLYRLLKGDPLISNTDFEAMGLPLRPVPGWSHHPVPTSLVESWVILAGPGMLEIRYRDYDSLGKGKPRGVHGAELLFTVSDTIITNHDQLLASLFDTRSPFRITFPDSQRGKTVYYSLRWQNTTGQKGPWNQIQSAVIP